MTQEAEALMDEGVDAVRVRGLLTIGDLASRTGLMPATLRMWEQRHGFPVPRRLASGHRRYRESDVERVRDVIARRAAGVRLDVAIAEAQRKVEATAHMPDGSLYSTLRNEFGSLRTYRLSKATLLGMSWAIEDEVFAIAQRSWLLGFFQKERFFDQALERWLDLAKTSRATFSFATFDSTADRGDGINRVHLEEDSPIRREWAIVADGTSLPVVLSAAELPGQQGRSQRSRRFEALWSTDPVVVRRASELSLQLGKEAGSTEAAELQGELSEASQMSGADPAAVSALHARMLAYVDELLCA